MNKKLGDLEFRINDGSRNPEIVRHTFAAVPVTYTLLWYNPTGEGYEIKFVGNRPFDPEIIHSDLWKLMKYGQKVCDAIFEIENE